MSVVPYDYYPKRRSPIVVQDIESYELAKETLTLLEIPTLGDREIEQGRVTSAESAIRHVRQRRT